MVRVGDGLALEVAGGVGGVSATQGRMVALARAYDDLGDRMRDRGAATVAAAADPDLLLCGALAPVELARAEAALLGAALGPDGALQSATGWETDAVAVRATAAGLAATDALVGEVVGRLAHTVGAVAAPGLLGAGLVAGGLVAANPALWPALWSLARSPALGGPDGGAARLAHRLGGAAVDHPGLVGPAALAAAGAVDAVGPAPGLGLLAGPVLGPALALAGGPGVSRAAAVLARVYGPEGPPVVTRRLDLEPAAIAAPRSVADLLDGLADTSALSAADPAGADGTIAVDTVTGPNGSRSHVVHLPGTDDMTTLPWTRDDDVRDLGTNLRLGAGADVPGTTTYGAGVLVALEQAGVRPDEPVVMVGHSQGGLQALAIAAQDTPYDVRQVVTTGAPTVPSVRVPDDVGVLSFERTGDVVPLLDGAPPPDTASWVTVSFDDEPGPDDGPGERHSLRHYREAAAATDAAVDPSLVEVRRRLAEIGLVEGAIAERRVYRITR